MKIPKLSKILEHEPCLGPFLRKSDKMSVKNKFKWYFNESLIASYHLNEIFRWKITFFDSKLWLWNRRPRNLFQFLISKNLKIYSAGLISWHNWLLEENLQNFAFSHGCKKFQGLPYHFFKISKLSIFEIKY